MAQSSMLENISANRLTSETIKRMFELITGAVVDPKFQELVYTITHALPGKDYTGEVNSIFHWVKQNIRYTRDPYGVELVQDPWSTINRGRGDCDDMSILIGAMGEVMGNPSRFITVSTRPDKEPCHVYPELFTKGRWVALDATVAGSSPGWRPSAGITDRQIWTRADVGISGYDGAAVEGLGMLNAGFFRSSLAPIDLVPGVPHDISHTYTDLMPGTPVQIHRPQPGTPRAMVARYSDLTEQTGPGGIVYDGAYPIRDQKSYRDSWSFIPRNQVPIRLDPWGKMKPWKADWAAALPQPNTPEDNMMANVGDAYSVGMAGLDGINQDEADQVVSAAVHDTAQKVATGKIDRSQAENHAKSVIDAVTTGDVATVSRNPATKATVIAIAKRRGRQGGGGVFAEPSLAWLPPAYGAREDQQLNGLGEYYSRGVNLGELGEEAVKAVTNAIHQDVSAAVASGAVPPAAAPAAAAKVVDAVQTGDSSVLNMRNTPATAAVVKKIKQGRGSGTARTPATKPHHPVSSGATREGRMRARSTDYWEADPSVEWVPQFYGLSGVTVGNSDLYGKVHALLKRHLPGILYRSGVHPSKVAALFGRKYGVEGLGQVPTTVPPPVDPATTANAASAITGALVGVIDPNDAQAVANAVGQGVQALIGQAAPPPSGFSFNLKGWGVPLLVVAGLGTVAYMMSKKGKTSRYRSNPKRRSGGKGGGNQKLILLALAGGAAYMIMKPKAAVAGPAAPVSIGQTILNAALKLFGGGPSGSGQTTAAAGNIASTVGKAFAPSGSPSSPAAQPAQQPAPDISTAVTSLPSDTGAASGGTADLSTMVVDTSGFSPDTGS